MKKIMKVFVFILISFLFIGNISANEHGGGGGTFGSSSKSSPTSCLSITTKDACNNSQTNNKFACVWVDTDTGKISDEQENGYCNFDNLQYVACGKAIDIPKTIPEVTSFIYSFLQIGVAIILIITGMIRLLKAITAGKEDEMKKAKSLLIRKLIAAVLVFFVAAIVKFVVSIAADNDDEVTSVENCINCFISGSCKNAYIKTTIPGTDTTYCTSLDNLTNPKTCDKYLGIDNEAE